MKSVSLKLTVLALAGAMAMGSAAKAGGLFDDDDDNGYSNHYNRQSLSSYCYQHPDDDACDPYAKRYQHKRSYNNSHYSGRCAALVRAVGKRNLVTAFARNSARFAWSREARFVHGDQYANWNYARNPSITCTNYGALKSCEATATPCRP
jgi:hypothetical protein